jgi:uncharacterized protein
VRATILAVLLTLLLGGCTIQLPAGAQGGGGPAPTAADGDAGGRGQAEDIPIDQDTGRPPDDMGADAGGTAGETLGQDERSAVSVVNEFWTREFRRQGARYQPPRVAGGYTGTDGPSCGGQPSVPGNAFYCPSGDFLAWDDDLMRAGYDQIGDAWVYLVIAHEWGHAIQARLRPAAVSEAVELQADCLAGATLQGAADEGLLIIEQGDEQEITDTLTAVADDYPWTDSSSHGDASERTAAFNQGTGGGVESCLS